MPIEHADNLASWEEQLRAVAPTLPPTLKARTLALCAQQANRQQHQHRRSSKRLMWGLAGVYFFQWLVISLLDWKQTALVTITPAHSRAAYASASTMQNHPTALWRTVQVRSQTVAALTANRSEWSVSPESG